MRHPSWRLLRPHSGALRTGLMGAYSADAQPMGCFWDSRPLVIPKTGRAHLGTEGATMTVFPAPHKDPTQAEDGPACPRPAAEQAPPSSSPLPTRPTEPPSVSTAVTANPEASA